MVKNLGPDTPYGGPAAGDPPSVDIPEIIEFNVVSASGPETVATPSALTTLRPAIEPLQVTPGTAGRNVSLVEITDIYGRTLPTVDARGPWAVNFAAGTGGTLTGNVSQTVADTGDATLVLATPDPGYHFVDWTGDGGFVTTDANPLTARNVTADMNITANFAVNVAGTTVLPDYSKPVLIPSSQTATAWTNVIPNALASYYTYVPYSHADAVALGFPATCGNPAKGTPADLASTEDCYTITVKKVMQDLALPGIFGGGSGLLNPATSLPFVGGTRGFAYGSGGVNWTPPGASVAVTGNAPAPFVDGTFGTTGIWHFPSPTIRGTKGRPIRVQWLNELPNEEPAGFDPTVDCGPNAPNCFPYNRIVTHVHGAHVTDDSDGYTAAWFTPLFAMKGPGWAPSTHGPEGTYLYPMDSDCDR